MWRWWWWCVLLLLVWWWRIEGVQIESSYVVTDPTGPNTSSSQNAYTVLSLAISSADGQLGFDETGSWEGTVTAVDANLQQTQYDVLVTWNQPTVQVLFQFVGWVERNYIPFQTTVCRNRTTPLELASGIFTGPANGTANQDNGGVPPLPLRRRLLQINVGQEGEQIPAELQLSPDKVGLLQQGIANDDAVITNTLDNTDTYTTQTLAPALAEAAIWGQVMSASLNDTAIVSNQTAIGFDAFNASVAFILNRYNQVVNTQADIVERLNQSASSMNSTGAALIAQQQQLANQISAGALGSQEVVATMNSMLDSLTTSVNRIFDGVAWSRSFVDQSTRNAGEAIKVADAIRLNSDFRHASVAQHWQLRDNLAAEGLNVQPFIGPGVIRPQGFVSPTVGNITDQGEFLRFTIYWNSQDADPSSSVDPDVGVPLNSLQGDQLALWNSVQPSDQGVAYKYANQRIISFFCDNDFLLANRESFLTIQTVKSFIGPVGCTPDVDCNCYVRLESARCSLHGGTFYTSTTEALPPLSQATDICQSAADLGVWFSPSGPSITGQNSVQYLTSATDLDVVMVDVCSRTIGGVSTPIHGPDHNFLVYSSFTGISDDNLGGVLALANLPSQCSANAAEMIIQNQNGVITAPYLLYIDTSVATTELFTQVSTAWDAEKYGIGPLNFVGIDTFPFRTVNVTQQAGMPLLTQYCETTTTGFVGPVMEPLYSWRLLPGQQQTVTITIKDQSTGHVVTQVTTTDGTVHIDPRPQATLPIDMLSGGYLGCLLLPCPTQSIDPQTNDTIFAQYVFDTPLGALMAYGPPQTREFTASYILQFANDLQGHNPYSNPKGPMDPTQWLQQNNQTHFDPRLQGPALSNYITYLLADNVTGQGVVCDSPSAQWGQWCNILANYVVLPKDPLLPELDGTTSLVQLMRKNWNGTFLAYLPGLALQQTPLQTKLECPNPQQIVFNFDGRQVVQGAATPILTIDNQHSYDINITVAIVSADNNGTSHTPCAPLNQTRILTNYSAHIFNLLYCDLQHVVVSVQPSDLSQPPQVCWDNLLNLTALAQQLGVAWYNGSSDLAGAINGTSGVVGSLINSEIQAQDDQLLTSLALQVSIISQSDAATIQAILDLRALRRSLLLSGSDLGTNTSLAAQQALVAKLLFGNQNLQEAATTALALQISTTDRTTNATNALRQQIADARAQIDRLNIEYANYSESVKELGGAEFQLSAGALANIQLAQELEANQSAQNSLLLAISNRTFAPPLLPTGEVDFDSLGPWIPASYQHIDHFSSFLHAVTGFTSDVAGFAIDEAKQAIHLLKLNPHCPLGIQLGCAAENLVKKLFSYLIMIIGVIALVALGGLLIYKAATTGVSAAVEKSVKQQSQQESESEDEEDEESERLLRK